MLANISRLAELLHLLLKASDVSEWTVVQKLGLIEIVEASAVQAEPTNLSTVRQTCLPSETFSGTAVTNSAAAGRVSLNEGSATKKLPTQWMDRCASWAPLRCL